MHTLRSRSMHSLIAVTAILATFSFTTTSAPSQSNQPSADLVAPPSSRSCPIDFVVSRNTAFRLDRANDSNARPKEIATLDLFFHPLESRRAIRSATITVHAQAPGRRLSPASLGSEPEVTEWFTLNASSLNPVLLHSEISLHRSHLVVWVDLTELRYTDGSTWRRSIDSSCTAAPNGYRLVATLP